MKQSWKYISISSCVKTVIYSLIAFATIFVPYFFEPNNTSLPVSVLPVFGTGKFFEAFRLEQVVNTTERIIGNSFTANVIFALDVSVCIFYAIIVIDILFALILMIFRFNTLRKIFKLISVIFGIIMILTNLTFIATIVFKVMYYFNKNGLVFTDLWPFILKNAIIYYVALVFFSFVMIIEQFKWFSKPY